MGGGSIQSDTKNRKCGGLLALVICASVFLSSSSSCSAAALRIPQQAMAMPEPPGDIESQQQEVPILAGHVMKLEEPKIDTNEVEVGVVPQGGSSSADVDRETHEGPGVISEEANYAAMALQAPVGGSEAKPNDNGIVGTGNYCDATDYSDAPIEALHDLVDTKPRYDKPFIWTVGETNINDLLENYANDMRRIEQLCAPEVPAGSKFVVMIGDYHTSKDITVLSKARNVPQNGEKTRIALLPLNSERHWGPLSGAPPTSNVPWDQRKEELIWRGANTGLEGEQRHRFVEALNKAGHNVAISQHVQSHWWVQPEKGDMSPEDMLGYKYLLSLEGNDIATSLKWMLRSDSVVVMPRPKVESWLGEGKLKPGEHYVELEKPEDVDQVLNYLRQNDAKAREISTHANEFMRRFENKGADFLQSQRDEFCPIVKENAAWTARQLKRLEQEQPKPPILEDG